MDWTAKSLTPRHLQGESKKVIKKIKVIKVINASKVSKVSKVNIEIEFELTLLTYKVFSCKDVRSKFLGVRLLAVQSNTQSRS